MKLLDFEKDILDESFNNDGLLIMARGLCLERIVISLIRIYCEPTNLVLIINANIKDEEYIIDELKQDGCDFLPKSINSDISVQDRISVYMGGGVLFITNRILVVDLLINRIPVNLVAGIIVYRAHKTVDSCQESFILRLYRERNSIGFIKAFSDSPNSFTKGYCQLERTLKNLFLKNLFLWPRFRDSIVTCFNQNKIDVVELHIPLSKLMKDCQTNLLDLIHACIKELKLNSQIVNMDEINIENATLRSFDRVLRHHLDPIWHQLSSKVRQIVADLKTLQGLLESLTQHDCYYFNSLVSSLRSNEDIFKSNSGWLFTESAEKLIEFSKQRTKKEENKETGLILDECPKLGVLSEVLDEIREMKMELLDSEVGRSVIRRVFIAANNEQTCDLISNYLRNMPGLQIQKTSSEISADIPTDFKPSKVLQVDKNSVTAKSKRRSAYQKNHNKSTLKKTKKNSSKTELAKKKINNVKTEMNMDSSLDLDNFSCAGSNVLSSTLLPESKQCLASSSKSKNSSIQSNDCSNNADLEDSIESENQQNVVEKHPSLDSDNSLITEANGVKYADQPLASESPFIQEFKMPSSCLENIAAHQVQPHGNPAICVKQNKNDSSVVEAETTSKSASSLQPQLDEVLLPAAQHKSQVDVVGASRSDLLTFVHPMYDSEDPFKLRRMVDELRPEFVIFYDADVVLVRQLEVFKAINPGHELRTYFLIYANSIEEQRYLTSLAKEQKAFEYLIQEKANMVVPEEREGRDGVARDLGKSAAIVGTNNSTRVGGTGENEKQLVVVDMREFRSELPSLLHRRGIDVLPVTLQVGDYILSPDICVERKSVSDLIGSLHNGRLYTQSLSMCRTYKKAVLLIEFDPAKPFILQDCSTKQGEATCKDIISRIVLLTLHFPRLYLVWSQSPFVTVEIFEDLKDKREQPVVETAMAITGADPDAVSLSTGQYNAAPYDMLLKLPGISHKNCHLILRHVKNLAELASMDFDQLKQLLGNEQQAKQLHDFMQLSSSSLEYAKTVQSNEQIKKNTGRNKILLKNIK